jgi:hypothetical protein
VGDSVYHGFTTRADKQVSQGLTLQSSYTISKMIDSVQERFGGRSTFIDPNNLSLSRAIGVFDRPHHFVTNFIYELPFGPGGSWAKDGLASKVIGKWQMSGIATLSKGLPMVITGPNNTRLPGVAVRLKDPVLDADQRTLTRYFDTSAFAPAPTFSMGNDSRTQPRLRGPASRHWILLSAGTSRSASAQACSFERNSLTPSILRNSVIRMST